MGVDASGKIVVVGQAATAEFEQVKFGAVRYTDDGSLDPSFATGGTVEIQFDQPSGATGLAFDPLGHLVIAGSSGEWGALVRLTSDGVMDPAFGDGGTQIETAKEMGLSGTALDTAGRIVVLGTESIGQLGIARFTSAGVVDTSFGAMGFGEALPLAGWRQIAWDLAIQADGRIVVVGEYGDLTTGDFLVARYCP